MAVGVGINPNIAGISPQTTQQQPSSRGVDQKGFRDALQNFKESEAKLGSASTGALKFSNHAVERMRSRGISFDPGTLEKIGMAVDKAAAKGSKNTLLLSDDAALVVSVKDRTVVTVMDKGLMKDNVFTNIDSTVLV